MLLSICMGCLMQLAVVLAGCFLYMDFFVVCTVILAALHLLGNLEEYRNTST